MSGKLLIKMFKAISSLFPYLFQIITNSWKQFYLNQNVKIKPVMDVDYINISSSSVHSTLPSVRVSSITDAVPPSHMSFVHYLPETKAFHVCYFQRQRLNSDQWCSNILRFFLAVMLAFWDTWFCFGLMHYSVFSSLFVLTVPLTM